MCELPVEIVWHTYVEYRYGWPCLHEINHSSEAQTETFYTEFHQNLLRSLEITGISAGFYESHKKYSITNNWLETGRWTECLRLRVFFTSSRTPKTRISICGKFSKMYDILPNMLWRRKKIIYRIQQHFLYFICYPNSQVQVRSNNISISALLGAFAYHQLYSVA